MLATLVLLGRQASAPLEQHLGPAVAEVGEDDGHQLVVVLTGLVAEGEHEPLGLDHLAVFVLPLDLAAAGPATIVARHAPPFLTSIDTEDTGTSASLPPNQSVKRSGSIHSFHTCSGGASKTRVIVIPSWAAEPGVGGSVSDHEEEDQDGKDRRDRVRLARRRHGGPGRKRGHQHGGWTFEIDNGEEGAKFKLDEAFDAEALLLGRVTYEGFAAARPSQEGEFADKFNTMPKYVVSSTLEEAGWNNSRILKGDVAEEVAKLRQGQDGNIVVHGSAQLVQTLVEHDLVDEVRLMVFPGRPGDRQASVRRHEQQEAPAALGLQDGR